VLRASPPCQSSVPVLRKGLGKTLLLIRVSHISMGLSSGELVKILPTQPSVVRSQSLTCKTRLINLTS
ncbi:MAG: hypothetical protein OSA84_08780, partial [Akkermansiaceae bacterium]|nr:hypothetical protein [Akkermansiaceae bacterium]